VTRRTLVRGLRWTLGIAAVLLLVLVALVWFALSSEWAARRLLAEAVGRTPALVRIGQVTGRLAGPLELRDVVVHTEGLSARVDQVLFQWRPTALLGKRVELEQLRVSGVRILMADSVPEEPDTLPEARQRIDLPVEVVLGNVRVERVSVDAPGGLRLRHGELVVAGTARNYALQLEGELSTPAVQQVEVRAAARGDLDRLKLDSATASLLKGEVTAEGTIGWWPEIGWKLALAGQALRPAPLLADSAAWPGAVSFRATTEGVLDTIGPVAEVVLDTLTGTLRGQPLGGAFTVRARGEEYAIPGLVLSWGPTRLDASGRAGELLDLRFDLSAPRLGLAVPGATGSLTARGTATGPLDSARITADFTGRRLGYQESRLAALTGRADMGLAPDGRTDLDLRAERAVVAGRRIDRMVVTLRGTRDDHRLSARVEAPDATLRLGLGGGIRPDSSWSGAIQTLDLRSRDAGDWQLVRATALSAGSICAIW
jgi:translocation and assembly module TamB